MFKKLELYLTPIALLLTYLSGGNIALAVPTSEAGEVMYLASADEEDLTVLDQVTSVSQLSDIQPTDWAFQALQSLVERYGCIAGYPDGSYRGNRAMTRFEFAAGLNACLDRITELIASSTADLVTREDLTLLQRIQEEFAAELATLRGRVDALEARTGELEVNQFSTTTKLTGVVNFALTSVFEGDNDSIPILQERVRLEFNTSFTGRDLLITRMVTGNSGLTNAANSTPEQSLSTQWYGNFGNFIGIATLYYLFPVTDNFVMLLTPVGGLHADYAFPAVNPFLDDFDKGTTAISPFAQRNPILRLGGGSGLAFVYFLNPSLSIGGGYYAGEAFNPSEGRGLFNGSQSAGAVLRWQPARNFAFGLTYNHAYFRKGQFGFDDNQKTFFGPSVVGTGVVNNTLAQFPTETNSYGIEFSWQLSPKFNIGAWGGYTKARAIDVGDGEIWTYALTLAFPDLGKEGSLGGIIVGVQPYLENLEGVPDFPNDPPIHVEVFYKFQINDNISLTPGAIWNSAPNQNEKNDDLFIGTFRTTFTF